MPLKKKIIIIVMLVLSVVFLYEGFSLLFHPSENLEEKIVESK